MLIETLVLNTSHVSKINEDFFQFYRKKCWINNISRYISVLGCGHASRRKANEKYMTIITTGTFSVMVTGRLTLEWEQCNSSDLLVKTSCNGDLVLGGEKIPVSSFPIPSFHWGQCRVISIRQQTKPPCQHTLSSREITPAGLGGISLALSVHYSLRWHQLRHWTGTHRT